MKVTIKTILHWCQRPWEDTPVYSFFPHDMTTTSPDYAIVGEYEFEVEIPDDFDPLPQRIAALRKEKSEILAKAHVQAENIEDQIQRLLCIEHKEEV